LLVFETAGSKFRPDDRIPAVHLGFSSAALILTAAGLPNHAAMGLNFGNVSVSKGLLKSRRPAEGGVSWRRNDDLDCSAKSRPKQAIGWLV